MALPWLIIVYGTNGSGPPPPPDVITGGDSYQKAYKRALERRNLPRQQPPDIQYSASILARSGGHARAASLSANMRSKIASIAAKARWK